VALMAVAVSARLDAQTTVAPRLVVRALTNAEISTYKLPSTTQVSGGLTTVALGEPFYLEVDVDATIPSNNIAGVIWSVVSRPAGSNAALADSPLASNVPPFEPSDRAVYQVAGRKLLRPDVRGVYIVSATVTAGSSGSTTLAQTYTAGTYTGISACKQCHNTGPAIQMVGAWSQTAHASIFTNVINGTAIPGYTESASCAGCHTVGFDGNSTAPAGGFSALMGTSSWSFPSTGQATNWSKMPANLQNVANIQCENCHGPGSEHAASGGANAIAVAQDSGACQVCHDEPTHHIKGATWDNSLHAVTTADPAGNAGCVGCHTGNGFIQRASGISPITDTSYHAIDCYTCHEPHGITQPSTAAHLVRSMASATLADGTQIPLAAKDSQGYTTSAGAGLLCMQCHQARQNAATYVDSTAGNSHWGPHHGTQADMLMGVNGYTYGQKIPTSAHQFVVADSCVTCHMQTVAATDPAFLQAGDHTFKLSYTAPVQPKEDIVAACQTCHGPDLKSFDFALFDYNGDGKIEGVQTEVQHLLDQLSTMLPPDNTVKSALTIYSTWTKPQLEAAWNWQLVNNDGSKGIHNTAYAVGLLKASIANLQSHK
jgi:hypothetical protein